MKNTDKQIAANRANALKSTGPKSAAGKVVSSANSLKHGLLAKEVVVLGGSCPENPEQFDNLLKDLCDQFKPEGTMEEMLVEKIAVAYWRLKRAQKYEVGLVHQDLNNAEEKYYEIFKPFTTEKKYLTDDQIDNEIKLQEKRIDKYQDFRKLFKVLHKSGKGIEDTYKFEDNWNSLFKKLGGQLKDLHRRLPTYIRGALNKSGWTDEEIWNLHFEVWDDYIAAAKRRISDLNKQKEKNKLAIQIKEKLASVPGGKEIDRLLKYETTIERQFYKALDQLERLQRLRAGDNVPIPLKINMDLNTSQSG